MQAKDITKEAFVAAVRAVKKANNGYASTLLVSEELNAPHKVVMAKTRKLMNQGVVDPMSCPCGCNSPLFLPEDFPKPLIQQIADRIAAETDIPRGFFDA